MGFAHEYADAIMWRGRVYMEPVDFTPNWPDQPRKGKFYPGAVSFPLPDGNVPGTATVEAGLGPGDGARFTLPLLGGMLKDSYGLLARRLAVQANTDLGALPYYPSANWSRGTASGGGLYPVSIYWVTGASGPAMPGIYYYSHDHHAMQRLLVGDVTAGMREVLGGPAAGTATDQFLVLGIKYWQNSFKYNSFSYHAVSMDIGTVIQTWRTWARAQGLDLAPTLWFDEERLSRLLGVPGEEEGLFAVVPLAWDAPPPSGCVAPQAGKAASVAVTRADVERSRRVRTFETLQLMHRTTTEHAAARPLAGALAAAAPTPAGPGEPVPLPAPQPLTMNVRTALRRRRSSFGRFDAQRPIEPAQLAATLAAMEAATVDSDAGEEKILKLYTFINHVRGIRPGAYEYEPATNALRLVKAGPPGAFLQRNYFLSNYNLEQAGAVIVPVVRTTAVLDAVGDRGYRLVGATIGAAAQSCYTAAAALDVGCGAALGFDNISFIEELGLGDTGEAPLLILLIGHERPGSADFRYDIA
jgi:SagB-type dehydrogenase family enzyme